MPPGQGRAGAKPVSLKALAEHLKLSPTTVSLVMNRSPGAISIPQETKERVLAAARKLNYRPNFMARSLRSKRTFTVGVLVPEVSEGYAASILSGIDVHLLQEGYFFLLCSHRTKADLLEEYLSLLRDRAVEGYILVNTPIEEAPPLPTVAVSGHRKLPGVTNVVIDHERAAVLALSHLAKRGHERIAFFKGHAKSADTEERWQAILQAAGSLGIRVWPELTLQLQGKHSGGIFTPEEGYKEGYAFGRRLLARRSDFTALFAFNDLSAIGAMRAFRDAGRRVPDDVSVVGFDDIQSAAFQNPSLTTVRQPLARMGEIAARILLRRLSGDRSDPDTVTVEPELVERESTARPPDASRKRRGPAARAVEGVR